MSECMTVNICIWYLGNYIYFCGTCLSAMEKHGTVSARCWRRDGRCWMTLKYRQYGATVWKSVMTLAHSASGTSCSQTQPEGFMRCPHVRDQVRVSNVDVSGWEGTAESARRWWDQHMVAVAPLHDHEHERHQRKAISLTLTPVDRTAVHSQPASYTASLSWAMLSGRSIFRRETGRSRREGSMLWNPKAG